MKLPVSMEPSPSPAAQRRAEPGPLRVLLVAGEGSGGLLQSLRQWAPDMGIEVEAAPDLPRAVRQLAAQRWDIVLAVLGERADEDVTWWVEALRGRRNATGRVQGESGSGKEVVARAIHLNGRKAAGPFVAVNCAAIPENLLESELFGHGKGAFTGAVARKVGRFEQAAGGTVFLDEIVDMSLALQAKILRATQEREIERLGGPSTIPVDVRLIAATNRDLRAAIAQGRFREDLYYRLAVVTIQLPKLADRGDDLVLLTAYFVRQFAERYGKPVRAISDRALALTRNHAWAGHVRKLRR